MSRQPVLPQEVMFQHAEQRMFDGNALFMELVNHPTNPLMREDLEAMLARRPERWGRFRGFLDQLPRRSAA